MDSDATGDVPEDVEMDFAEAGVGEEVPTLDVIITGEVRDSGACVGGGG
jgi:hypothetical protein